MADNIVLNAGSLGATLAADDVASVYYQRIKVDGGGDGAAVPILAAGGVEASALRVTIASDSTGVLSVDDNGASLTVDNANLVSMDALLTTIDADTGNITTAVELIDDCVYADDADWTDNTSKHLLVGGVYQSAPHTVTDGDVSPALMDVNGRLIVAATDNGGTLTVDNAGLTALNGAISGTEVQVDVVAALPAGTNAIGKLAANSGVDIGDVDVTSVVPGTGATNLGKAEDGGHTSGDVGVMALGVRNDTPNAALSGTDLDYTPIAVYRTGALRVAPPEEDFAVLGSNSVKKYYTNAGAVTDGIVWSPAAGKRWYVTDIFINVSAAATVTLEDDLAGGDSAVWKAELAANSGWSHSFSTPLFSGEDAADLIITTSAANVYVTVTGYEI